MIWNFKDGKNRHDIITLIKGKLSSTFKSYDLKRLTFVCIPASSTSSNIIRYKIFSEIICTELGMRNAFSHITITKEKTQFHLGGTDDAEYSFDQIFFRNAQVILFDDIVTRGHSMNDFKERLNNIGANVICAISIGKTCNDYLGNNSLPHPWTGTI